MIANIWSKIDDDKLSTNDICNIENKKIWFWNESSNKINLNTKKERDNINLEDIKLSRIKQTISLEVSKT